jgi:hypothetical protein
MRPILATLTPVVFVPGYGGNSLYATVDAKENLPSACANSAVPIGSAFMVLPNSTLSSNDASCLYSLLTMGFDETNGSFVPLPGINVHPASFGDFKKGISATYYSFADALESWGYILNLNAFGAPYDYRYMSASALQRTGFVRQLQTLVEKASKLNYGARVMLIGHSNGGPTIYSFLGAMTAEWKEQYISGMIGLSGNFLGQMNAYKTFFVTNSLERQRMITTWEATYTGATWGSYAGLRGVGPILTTYASSPATESEANYTSSLADMRALFRSVGHSDWATRLEAAYSSMDRRAPPGSDAYCLFGRDLDTSYSFVLNGTIPSSVAQSVRYINGDGNQDLVDNAFCEQWAHSAAGVGTGAGVGRSSGTAPAFKFESKAFSGVEHMQMYSDPAVLDAIREILNSYSTV